MIKIKKQMIIILLSNHLNNYRWNKLIKIYRINYSKNRIIRSISSNKMAIEKKNFFIANLLDQKKKNKQYLIDFVVHRFDSIRFWMMNSFKSLLFLFVAIFSLSIPKSETGIRLKSSNDHDDTIEYYDRKATLYEEYDDDPFNLNLNGLRTGDAEEDFLIEKKIFGGYRSRINEWNFMAAIFTLSNELDSHTFKRKANLVCSAVIYDEDHLITAASCV